jgi:hypothetical protein
VLLTTSKGELIDSPFTDSEAVAKLSDALRAGLTTSTFAADLCLAASRGRLSIRQRPWLHKLALEIGKPRPEPVAVAADFTPLVVLLQAAGRKLKHPRVTLDREGRLLRLSVAGAKSKYTGSIMVTDGRPFGQNVWYGRIEPSGQFMPSGKADAWVTDTLVAFAADPAGFAASYGHTTGSCCFCGLELSTTESTAVGYGPVCADNYGLPWGAKVAKAKRGKAA